MRNLTLASAVALALGFLLAAPAPARALDAFDAQSYEAPVDPFGYVTVQGARTLRLGRVHTASHLSFTDDALDFRDAGGGRLETIHQVDLAFGIGIAAPWDEGGLQLGIDLPVVAYEEGVIPRPLGPVRVSTSGASDLRLELKASFFDLETAGAAVGFRGWVDVPTGVRDLFISNDGAWAAGIEVLKEADFGLVRLGTNIGWEWLDGEFESTLTRVDDSFRFGAGIALAPLRDIAGCEPLELVFEVTARTLSKAPFGSENDTPVECMGAIKYSGSFHAMFGFGGGLNEGIGAPDTRFALTIGGTY